MRICVAMGTFRGERYLMQQLQSIATQTRSPDAVYVSDDASDDDTVEILGAFAASAAFPVHITVSEKRLGVTKNFERVIGEADGDVIVLADQDDVWLPDKLAKLEQAFTTAPSRGFAFSDAYLVDSDGRRTGKRLWGLAGFGSAERQRLREDPFARLMSRSIVGGCTLAFRREYLPLFVPFPPELTFARSPMSVLHDGWIAMALAPVCSVAVIDEPLIEYRIHANQTIGIPLFWLRRLVPLQLLRWRAAAVPTREYRARLEGMMTLLRIIDARVALYVDAPIRDVARARIEGALAHLQVRADIDGPRRGRVRAVVREARTGRYARYSLGLASAVADLVRRHGAPFSDRGSTPK